jgi:hypothetical protein
MLFKKKALLIVKIIDTQFEQNVEIFVLNCALRQF